MSHILQNQRRALESLQPSEKKDIVLRSGQTYWYENRKIFLSGISRGVGTCSDLHGINIAVFESNLESHQWFSVNSDINCAWAAVLRYPAPWEVRRGDPRAWLVVEGLKPELMSETFIRFRYSGKIKMYVSTIS